MPRPRKNWDLSNRAIREMRTREEKLRAVFGVHPSSKPKVARKKVVSIRGDVIDDLEYIRLLSELDTWKYVPEEVAQILFENIVETRQHYEDGDVSVDDISDGPLVEMAVRLFRLYLQGCNPWNRKLLPRVLQVDREVATTSVFKKRFKHGAEMDAVARGVVEDESEEELDFETIPDWDDL